jgi:hypothetical protein
MPINMIRFERLAYLSLVISLVAIVLDNATPTVPNSAPWPWLSWSSSFSRSAAP